MVNTMTVCIPRLTRLLIRSSLANPCTTSSKSVSTSSQNEHLQLRDVLPCRDDGSPFIATPFQRRYFEFSHCRADSWHGRGHRTFPLPTPGIGSSSKVCADPIPANGAFRPLRTRRLSNDQRISTDECTHRAHRLRSKDLSVGVSIQKPKHSRLPQTRHHARARARTTVSVFAARASREVRIHPLPDCYLNTRFACLVVRERTTRHQPPHHIPIDSTLEADNFYRIVQHCPILPMVQGSTPIYPYKSTNRWRHVTESR